MDDLTGAVGVLTAATVRAGWARRDPSGFNLALPHVTTECRVSLKNRFDVNESTGSIGAQAADYTGLTVGLVSAYVANNPVPATELAVLIASTHATLTGLGNTGVPATPLAEKLTPTQIRKSITHEALISFEDGKRYKTLKRHLTALGLTPETYRAKWGLPSDYPMVAPSYSETRAAVARGIGLGRYGRVAARVAEAAEEPEGAARPRKSEKPADA